MHENIPLGKKKNFGLNYSKQFDYDYMMEIGSDDLITNELLSHYKPFFEYGFFGVKDVAYINSEDGECRRLQSKSTYGAGRVISRKYLELLNFKLWDDKISRGMDNNSVFAFLRKGIDYKQVPAMNMPGVIDIKSDVNIWPFDHSLGAEYDRFKLYDLLSDNEVKLIEQCCNPDNK